MTHPIFGATAAALVLVQCTGEPPSAPDESSQGTQTVQAAAEDEDGGPEKETIHESELPNLTEEEREALPPDGGEKYNRLIFEQSPYLLIHATNPVDWYPWGEAAFEKARKEDKPVLLSVGYSTCHWCHVMERESFSDEEVAEVMNEHFVAVKVDREERPDIDTIYMNVTQAMTGRGGWPNTVFLTPDREPFYAGTYFPKEGRFGRPGLMDLLNRLNDAWENRRDEVLETAGTLTSRLQQATAQAAGEAPGEAALNQAFEQLASRYDATHGGFGQAPKFPSPHNFYFLLRHWKRSGDDRALDMVEHTLREMRYGGIFDQVGFGFHRYSTDAEWLLPHFEKMLYDQALLAFAYIETYQATNEPFYARTAEEIFTYVLRDMQGPEGGFYSAENADSEGEEGLFYIWTPEELVSVLGKEEAAFIGGVFNVEPGGNFREESTGEKTGRSILHRDGALESIAADRGMNTAALRKRIANARQKLFDAREKRVHPLKDDKILTDWNGLMIAALAKAGRALDEPKYTQAATRAAEFVLDRLRQDNGELWHRYRNGQSGLEAPLADYAYFIWGLIELYETTFDVETLQSAVGLMEKQIALFEDEANGGFFQTSDQAEDLLFRAKEVRDGARPSGNSVSALNLLRLGRITANTEWEQKAEEVMAAFGNQVNRAPSAHTYLMSALDFGLGPSYEVVLAGDKEREDFQTMAKAVFSRFIPNKVVLHRPGAAETPPIARLAEYTKNQTARDGKATAYVCRNYVCDAPTTEVSVMLDSLNAE